jgi:small subunit ribosomal protein S1
MIESEIPNQESPAAEPQVEPAAGRTPEGGTSTRVVTPPKTRFFNEDENDEFSAAEREEMLSLYEESLRSLVEGEIVHGHILAISDSEVTVDIGGKSEGVIPLAEFANRDELKVGDEIEVYL